MCDSEERYCWCNFTCKVLMPDGKTVPVEYKYNITRYENDILLYLLMNAAQTPKEQSDAISLWNHLKDDITQKVLATEGQLITNTDGRLANEGIIQIHIGYESLHTKVSPVFIADDPRCGLPFSPLEKYFQSFSKEQLELQDILDYDNPNTVIGTPPYHEFGFTGPYDIRTTQYLEVLRSVALQKGADPERMGNIIQFYKDIAFADSSSEPWESKLTLFSELEIEIEKTQVGTPTVMPLMCGVGKSTAISQLIHQYLKENRNDSSGKKIGLLIVTDSTERMHEYLNSRLIQGEKISFDHYKKDICIMTHNNITEAYRRAPYCPILIMTTQRYQNLSVEKINDFLETEHVTREAVIIDEHFPLHDITEINAQMVFGLIGVAATYVNPMDYNTEKRELISILEKFAHPFIETMLENEKAALARPNTTLYCYHSPDQYHAIDTDRLEKLAETIDKALNGDSEYWSGADTNTYGSIRKSFRKLCQAICALVRQGGLHYTVMSDNGKYYRSGVLVDIDHTDVIRKPSKPVIIMDGTGDLHPDYPHQDWISMSDRTWFDKRLDMLHLHFVDEATSATVLQSEKGEANIGNIAAWLRKQGMDPSQILAFTNKKVIEKVKKHFKNPDYFGNIKGRNDYAKKRRIVQIGLNNKNTPFYLMDYLVYNPDKMEEFKAMNRTKASEMAEAFISAPMQPGDSKSRYLLADIEQNMFRGSVRRVDDIKEMHYYVFCSQNTNKALYELARARYEPLGATVTNDEASRPQTTFYSRGDDSFPSRVLSWIREQPAGTVFMTKDITAALNQKYEQEGKAFTTKQVGKVFEKKKNQVYALVERIPRTQKLRRIDPDKPSPDEATAVPDQTPADEEPDTGKKVKTIPYPAQ